MQNYNRYKIAETYKNRKGRYYLNSKHGDEFFVKRENKEEIDKKKKKE